MTRRRDQNMGKAVKPIREGQAVDLKSKDPTIDIYPRGSKSLKIVSAVIWTSAVLLVFSVPACWISFLKGFKEFVYIFAAFWSIVPPIWFWYEFFWLYRVDGNPDTFELFKYGQDLGKAIWVAAAGTFVALAGSSFFSR
jgi:hypothetical protein